MLVSPATAAPRRACRRRVPGRSTLITSAPRSPSSIEAYGPASTREKSATISPSSGAWRPATLVRVRTLVISDLHLGAARTDLLRRAELREPLLEAVRTWTGS